MKNLIHWFVYVINLGRNIETGEPVVKINPSLGAFWNAIVLKIPSYLINIIKMQFSFDLI